MTRFYKKFRDSNLYLSSPKLTSELKDHEINNKEQR
jgi:hypothetical protein